MNILRLIVIAYCIILGSCVAYANRDHIKNHIAVSYSSCDRVLSITDSTSHKLTGCNLFVVGRNEYNDVDTFLEGFAYLPLHLNISTFYPGTFDVIVITESDTTIQQVNIQYCH